MSRGMKSEDTVESKAKGCKEHGSFKTLLSSIQGGSTFPETNLDWSNT